MQKNLQRITSWLLILAMLASIPFMYYVGKPNTTSLYVFDALVTALVIFPYFLFFILNIFYNQAFKQTLVVYQFTLLAIFIAAVMYYYDFFVDVTGQHGLIVIGIPFIQIGLAVITFLIVWWQQKGLKK